MYHVFDRPLDLINSIKPIFRTLMICTLKLMILLVHLSNFNVGFRLRGPTFGRNIWESRRKWDPLAGFQRYFFEIKWSFSWANHQSKRGKYLCFLTLSTAVLHPTSKYTSNSKSANFTAKFSKNHQTVLSCYRECWVFLSRENKRLASNSSF